MMNKLNILVAIFFAVPESPVYNVENKITCEWQPMKLECNRGEVLKIISANYGRTNASLCEPFENTDCRASGSLSIIKNKCEGKTSCTVMATNDVFGDPCYGVVKYIEAQYQCVPAPECTANQFRCDDGQCMNKSLLCNGYPDCSGGEDESGCNVEIKITCEWQPMTLECNRGEVLKIISANYGRTNASLCEPFKTTNCRASRSLSIIKNKCEGQTSCTVMAANYVFGDPCIGIVKYIEAQYQCVPAPVCTANQFRCDDGECVSKSLLCNGYPDCAGGEDERECNVETKITCEWQPMTLECNRGEVLKIMSANYGRTNASLCEPFENTNCRASESLSIIKNKCEGQTSCTVMATNYVFGDPCIGIVKYIEAQYQCVPAPACTANEFTCDDGECVSKSLLCNGYPDCAGGEDERECNVENKITCEWQPMKLECNRGEVLKIMSANYGRTNASLCEPFENTDCRASRSLSIIKNKCEGKTSCTVMATNYVFGDPCIGIVKYIEAQYQCVPAPICTANQFRCDDGECVSKSLLCNGYPDCAEGEDESGCNVENKITCEWQPMTLECNRGEVLKIISANYGRTNASLCEPFETTNCRASGSLSIIKNKCEGQTSCTVMAANYVFGDPCIGIVKYIEAHYQCVSSPVCTANQFRCDDGECVSKSLLCNGYPDCAGGEDERECNVENKITCEWQPMKLECNRGEVLKIMSANYGRTNASLCEPFENTNCRASGSLSIIKNKCEGKTSCTVMATNYVFGDPCIGIVKYIEAQYQCVPAPVCTANQFRCDDGECMSKSLLCNGYPDCAGGEDESGCNVENKITCEWQPMKLECNMGEVLKIISANYGRTNASLCEPFETTNCRASGSLSIIKNKCEGQRSCTVMATNYVFGDPCIGIVKYIEAQYQCVPSNNIY